MAECKACLELQDELADAFDQLIEVEGQLGAEKGRVADLEAALEDARACNTSLTDAGRGIFDEEGGGGHAALVRAQEGDIASLRQEVGGLKAELADKDASLDAARRELDEHVLLLDAARKELAEKLASPERGREEGLMRKCHEFQQQIEQLQQQLEEQNAEMETLKQNADVIRREGADGCFAEMSALETEVEVLKSQLEERAAVLEELRNDRDAALNAAGEAEAQQHAVEGRFDLYKLDKEQEVENLTRKLDEATESIEQLRKDNMKLIANKTRLAFDVTSRGRQLKNAKDQLFELNQTTMEAKAALEKGEGTIRGLEDRVRELLQEKDAMYEKHLSEVSTQQQEASQLRSNFTDMEVELAEAKRTLEKMRGGQLQTNAHTVSLEQRLADAQQQNEALARQLTKSKRAVETVVANKVKSYCGSLVRTRQMEQKCQGEVRAVKDELSGLRDTLAELEVKSAIEIDRLRTELDAAKVESEQQASALQRAEAQCDEQQQRLDEQTILLEQERDKVTRFQTQHLSGASTLDAQHKDLLKDYEAQRLLCENEVAKARRAQEATARDALVAKTEHIEELRRQQAANAALKTEIAGAARERKREVERHIESLKQKDEEVAARMADFEGGFMERLERKDAELYEMSHRVDTAEFERTIELQNVRALKEKVATLEADNLALKEGHQAQAARAEKTAEFYENERAELNRKIAADGEKLRREVGEMTERINILKQSRTAEKQLKDEALHDVDMLRTEMATLRDDHNALLASSEAALNKLRLELKKTCDDHRGAELRATMEHTSELTAVKGTLRAAEQELAELKSRQASELQSAAGAHAREKQDLERELARCKEAAELEGEARAEARLHDRMKELQTEVGTLRAEQRRQCEEMLAAKAAFEQQQQELKERYKADNEGFHRRVESERKHAASAAARQQALLDKMRRELSEERVKLEQATSELTSLRRSLAAAVSERDFNASQAKARRDEQDAWWTKQVDEQQARHAAAEATIAELKKKLADTSKSQTGVETRMETRCRRLEKEVSAANREAAAMKAKVDSLQVQLEERNRALKVAGQRIASLSNDALASPSPRRQRGDDDWSATAGTTPLSTRSTVKRSAYQDVELERLTTRCGNQEQELGALKVRLEGAQQGTRVAEERLAQAEADLTATRKDARRFEAEVDRLKEQVRAQAADAEDVYRQHRGALEAWQRDMGDLETKEQMTQRRTGADVASLRQSVAALETELKAREATITRLREESLHEDKHATSAKRSLEALLNAKTNEVRDLEYQLQKATDMCKQEGGAATACRQEVERLRSTSAQLNRELHASREEGKRASEELEATRAKLAEVAKRAERLEAKCDATERQRDVAREAHEREKTRLKHTVDAHKSELDKRQVQGMTELTRQSNAARAKLRRAEAEQSDYATAVRYLESSTMLSRHGTQTALADAAQNARSVEALRDELDRSHRREARVKSAATDIVHDNVVKSLEIAGLRADMRYKNDRLHSQAQSVQALRDDVDASTRRADAAVDRAFASTTSHYIHSKSHSPAANALALSPASSRYYTSPTRR